MARLARNQLLYDGCYAHVISRSMGKYKIFHDNEDFEVFCDLLARVKQEYGFKVFHYCLMNTHFHLAVGITEVAQFSKGLQKLKSLYIYKFHTKYKISGPIWRERYRSLLIENEAYLYACGQYIENNPVKAELVQESTQWQYSSSRYYIKGEKDKVVDGYGAVILPTMPKEIDIIDEEVFEKGMAIGSGFFRFRLKEAQKRAGRID